MSTFDTTRWYRDTYRDNQCRPIVSEPDVSGFIAVVSRTEYYGLVIASSLTPIPERHTVERRVPKVGERYIGYCGDIITVHGTTTIAAWVVVDDEVTP